jgi:endoglucanase
MKKELRNVSGLLKSVCMYKAFFIHLIIMLLFIPGCTLNVQAEPDIFIRVTQLGFLPEDLKTAIVLSNVNLEGKKAELVNAISNDEVYNCTIDKNFGVYGNFKYSYEIDFSSITASGNYYIVLSNKKSLKFSIGKNIFNGLADTLLQFFRVQRCGYTDPLLHKVCHIADASSLVENKKVINKTYDITGGWHDAGDYVKFLNTTAYATYMLLFSYDFDPVKFGFDKNKNNVADVLEEAKIGLDWLLRCNIDGKKLITQVQDLRDHDVGWRMPEDDQLGFDRPAYVGVGKNLIGIYSAALALGGKIWRDVMNYKEFSDKCLQTAEKFYAIKEHVPDIDSTGTGMYIDKNFEGKLSLGAIELYMSTGKQKYLEDAKTYADSAGSDFWWSWGDINSLAHYRISKYDFRFSEYLKKNLEEFNRKKNNNLFGKGTELSWGTNNTLLGISLQNILWKRLTHNSRFDSVSVYQRDYILGRNPWGISFISNVGKVCTKNFHHQIGKIKGQLPGGFSAGPATKKFLENYKIIYSENDKYSRFQTDADYYRDDTNDYLTNEPTITGNATAIFVFGSLSNNN